MITTIVFDLDDTLYDEIDYCRSGFSAVAAFLADRINSRSKNDIFSCLWKQFTAGNHTTTFNAALATLSIPYDNNLINELVQVYRNHRPTLRLPDDSREVLTQLAEKHPLALLTDGFLPAQRLKLEALGIEHYFECIIYTEELGRQFWKPSPVGFQRIIDTFHCQPSHTLYVADNLNKDFIAPNQLGLVTIAVLRPARLHAESSQQPNALPRHTIHDLRALPGLLQDI